VVEIPVAALDQLRDDVRRGASPRDIERRLAGFECEPIDRPLGRLAQHAKALATRLGKGDVDVVVESDGDPVDPRRFSGLWGALVHVVRNSVDHGIEPASERIAHGKNPDGRVTLRATNTSGALAIQIEDDGGGIDWDALVKLAENRGLPHTTSSDLVRAILRDGVSTRAGATSTSGRGVGMAAVYQAVTSLGGRLSVRSQRGAGTCWRVVLPMSDRALAATAAGSEPQWVDVSEKVVAEGA
jgi:two-component system chemotaxis sensor kinase CheA